MPEAILPTSRDLLRQRAMVNDILKRDTTPPMKPRSNYRKWLQGLDLGDLKVFYKVVQLEHPKRKKGNKS